MDVRDVPIVRWKSDEPLQAVQPTASRYAMPYNQGECGACWAIAAAACVADRLGIMLTQTAVQDVIHHSKECVYYGMLQGCNNQCDGGYMLTGMLYLHKTGLLDGATRRTCGTVYRANLYDTFGVTNQGYIEDPGLTRAQLRASADNIARELMHRGSVCATFNMFSNFMTFWNKEREDAVYSLSYPHTKPGTSGYTKDTQGSKSWSDGGFFTGPAGQFFVTAHSVVIAGFGTSADGQDYWICRNSWGATANRPAGLFRIVRGVNMCGIESDVLACLPSGSTDLVAASPGAVVLHKHERSFFGPQAQRFVLLATLLATAGFVLSKH